MRDETYFKIGFFGLLIITMVLGALILSSEDPSPVGLFVVRPDADFFECAKKVHGNYKFYYELGQEEFMFERNGELCYVNTMQFRVQYVKMFGRKPEVFIGGE